MDLDRVLKKDSTANRKCIKTRYAEGVQKIVGQNQLTVAELEKVFLH